MLPDQTKPPVLQCTQPRRHFTHLIGTGPLPGRSRRRRSLCTCLWWRRRFPGGIRPWNTPAGRHSCSRWPHRSFPFDIRFLSRWYLPRTTNRSMHGIHKAANDLGRRTWRGFSALITASRIRDRFFLGRFQKKIGSNFFGYFKLVKFAIVAHQKWCEVKVQKDLSLWAVYGFFRFSD